MEAAWLVRDWVHWTLDELGREDVFELIPNLPRPRWLECLRRLRCSDEYGTPSLRRSVDDSAIAAAAIAFAPGNGDH